MTTYTIIGINDNKTFCQCCGKVGLKRVVWVKNNDTEEVKHFGTTCALSPQKGFNLESQLKKHEQLLKNMNQACHAAYRNRGGKYTTNGTKLTPTNTELMKEIQNEYRRNFTPATMA